MVKQESTYCYEVSRNLFLVLCRKEVESMIDKKISGGMEGKGSKIRTRMRRLIPLHCELK